MNRCAAATAIAFTLITGTAFPSDVRKSIKEAEDFGRTAPGLVVRNEIKAYWSPTGGDLVYRVNTGPQTSEFIRLDLRTGKKSPAFDPVHFAKALAKAANQQVEPSQLPIGALEITDAGAFLFQAFGKSWRYSAADGLSADDRLPPSASLMAPEEALQGTRRTGQPSALTFENATAGYIEMFWVDDSGIRKPYGKLEPGKTATQSTYAGHIWLITDANGGLLAAVKTPDTPAIARIAGRVSAPPRGEENLSPDGKWRARILNHNLTIEPVGSGATIALSTDGSENAPYTRPIHWSPDSSKLIAFREKRVGVRQIHLVQSSPPDQLQPKLKTIDYPKPGDEIPQPKPRLFDIQNRREVSLDDSLFSNPWSISEGAWTDDSTEFTFAYNQRGHQVMRLVGIRGESGSVRTILEDLSKTFIDYSQKFFLRRLPATREILWASERSGYNHLYLVDEVTGAVKNPITLGDWNVREVLEVDEGHRQLLLKIVGIRGQDPYHSHFVRVNFDGSGFTHLTTGDANQTIEFSPDRKWILATGSRVDQPPVVELRSADDGELISELERADDSALQKTGWSRPERFVAKGRDGKTDIHGIIIRPTRFDPSKKYPVVEEIYAGPHDHFVPKSYFPWSGLNERAEMGWIIVKIDGMGTNWRSKAFQDRSWKNLMDSGFPDRIAWIKAAAAKRPWMDLSRIGIYGGSAGGQSALAGLLHHGDFYKVGVADCGCHDNRMDKIWWNEAWMGWPVDESYARNSNVTHVAKLTGKLMLIVGELDTNVDPASTAQVVNALTRADKDFEFVPIMNAGHGAAETPYGKRRRADFLLRHLSGPN
jgi:dipeptidyl-peptidase-4